MVVFLRPTRRSSSKTPDTITTRPGDTTTRSATARNVAGVPAAGHRKPAGVAADDHGLGAVLSRPDGPRSTGGDGAVPTIVAATARRFGGHSSINWHDRSLAPERQWGRSYEDLLSELRSDDRDGLQRRRGRRVVQVAPRHSIHCSEDSRVTCVSTRPRRAQPPAASLTVHRASLAGQSRTKAASRGGQTSVWTAPDSDRRASGSRQRRPQLVR